MVSDDFISDNNFNIIMNMVESGSKVIFYKSSLDDNLAGLLDIDSRFQEDDSWIVFRNIGLKCFDGSSSTDLKYNYSSVLDRPERHFFMNFDNTGEYIPVLTHNNKTIVGTRKYGKGQIIICGLKLKGKLDTTPLMSEMVSFLLNL